MIEKKIRNKYDLAKEIAFKKIRNRYNLSAKAIRSTKTVKQVNYGLFFYEYNNGSWMERYLPITSFIIRQELQYDNIVNGGVAQDILIEDYFKTNIQAFIPAPLTLDNYIFLTENYTNSIDFVATIRKTTTFTDESIEIEEIAAAGIDSLFEQEFSNSNTSNVTCEGLNYLATGFNLNYPNIEVGNPKTVYIDKIISKQQANDGVVYRVSPAISVKPLDYVIVDEIQYICKEVNFWIDRSSATKNIRLI